MTPPDRPSEIHGNRIDWSGPDVAVGIAWFIGIFILGQIVVAIVAVANGSADSNTTYAAAFIVGAIVEVAIGGVAIAMTAGKYGGGLRRLGVRMPDGKTFAWALAAFAGALVVAYVYGAIVDVFGIDQLKSDCAEQIPEGVRHTRWLLALAALVVIAFAPVFEELFFRGFVFPGLARAWGLALAIAVSGLLFSAAHLDYKSFIPIAGVGMVFAYAYWRSGTIFTTMLAHCAFNSTSIAFIAGGACDSVAGRPAALVLVHWLATLPLGRWL
jgi:membrane protease YdiL (CAAX protease family)